VFLKWGREPEETVSNPPPRSFWAGVTVCLFDMELLDESKRIIGENRVFYQREPWL